MSRPFAPVEDAIADIRAGRMVVVCDDEDRENEGDLTIAAPPELLRYVVEKGSIAVNGVSLTVVDVDAGAFSVSLIPETLERTTLGRVTNGTVVNLEVDILAKHVEKLLAHTH